MTELSSELERGFAAITVLIDRLMQEVKGKSETLIKLTTEFQYLQKSVEQLEYIVIDGNGERPLTTRVINLERTLQLLEEATKKNEDFRKSAHLTVGVALFGSVLSWLPLIFNWLRG